MKQPRRSVVPLKVFHQMLGSMHCCYGGAFPLSNNIVRAYYKFCGCFPLPVLSRVLRTAPTRFPTHFPSAGELRELLDSEHDTYQAGIRRTEARKELPAHVAPDPSAPYSAGLLTTEMAASLPEGPSKQKVVALAAEFERVKGPDDFYAALCRVFLPGETEPEPEIDDDQAGAPGKFQQP